MAHDGISKRHAYEVLTSGDTSQLMNTAGVCRDSTVPKLDNPLDAENDEELLEQVIEYYHERLLASPSALHYLTKRGITQEAIEHFQLGYADRTLGLRLPEKNRKAGAEIRQRLQGLGLYRESGHEYFNGCVTFPMLGNIYGRKTVNRQKSGVFHQHLHDSAQGIFNSDALKQQEIIECEGIMDALTFWCSGIRNVTAVNNLDGLSQELEQALIAHKIQKVYLAYDRDEEGELATQKDATLLANLGIECACLLLPHEHDINSFALNQGEPIKALQQLIASAQWIEGTQQNQSAPKASTVELQEEGGDVMLNVGNRFYRVRGLERNTSLDTLKINLHVAQDDLFYLDTLDLYTAKAREHFIKSAAIELAAKDELIKRDLGKLLLTLEDLQQRRQGEVIEETPAYDMSDAEREEALELLKDPNLLNRIIGDFEICGIVGETTNKLTGYLATVSRKLDKPLGVIIQSTSAAGKSSLMEAVLAMIPAEEQIKYSAMTGQSLYYLGESELKHKILAIAEEEGAGKASYALKLLQSEGELTIASTGKDDLVRMRTEAYHVEGPVMIFLTTTAIDIDEELLNRCLVLSVDESKEQTQAIHNLQREAETLSGLKRKLAKENVLCVHQNAQRLLRPLHVVNPHAPELYFTSHQTRARRDHIKYLTLIKTIALLHQHQREVKTLAGGIEYIEVQPQDIEAANRIADQVLVRSLDELPPQTRKLLDIIAGMKSRQSFNRLELRHHCGWGDTQLKIHLSRLVDMEYLHVDLHPEHRQRYLYGLTYDPNRSGFWLNWSGKTAKRKAPLKS